MEQPQVSTIIPGRLSFVSLRRVPKDTATKVFFTIDEELLYDSFFADFGPLNLSKLYRFCCKLLHILRAPEHEQRHIYYYSSFNVHKRANAAFLIGAFSILYLKRNVEEAYEPLSTLSPPLVAFRDASYGSCTYQLTLIDCLRGLHQALCNRFFDYTAFSPQEYEYYERVENGDFNWMVPDKFLAFAGPHKQRRLEDGYPLLEPADYFEYFHKHGVTDIIRLNRKQYDRTQFTAAGFQHHDLFFVDGSTPPEAILQQFIRICEKAKGVVAVHCKAGLGRTGTLIGCYIMKHYRLTAPEVIAWLRIARPGSVIGPQQYYLQQQQAAMWQEGDAIGATRAGPAGRPSWAAMSSVRATKMPLAPRQLVESPAHTPPPARKDAGVAGSSAAGKGTGPAAACSPGDEEEAPTQGDILMQQKWQRELLADGGLRIAPASAPVTPVKERPANPALARAQLAQVQQS